VPGVPSTVSVVQRRRGPARWARRELAFEEEIDGARALGQNAERQPSSRRAHRHGVDERTAGEGAWREIAGGEPHHGEAGAERGRASTAAAGGRSPM
jgi:hypothetical protein